jgi:hypothetical protein
VDQGKFPNKRSTRPPFVTVVTGKLTTYRAQEICAIERLKRPVRRVIVDNVMWSRNSFQSDDALDGYATEELKHSDKTREFCCIAGHAFHQRKFKF